MRIGTQFLRSSARASFSKPARVNTVFIMPGLTDRDRIALFHEQPNIISTTDRSQSDKERCGPPVVNDDRTVHEPELDGKDVQDGHGWWATVTRAGSRYYARMAVPSYGGDSYRTSAVPNRYASSGKRGSISGAAQEKGIPRYKFHMHDGSHPRVCGARTSAIPSVKRS